MVVGCVAATTAAVAAAADSGAGGGQSTGSHHGAYRLRKKHGAWGLRCWVVGMMEKVLSVAVAVLRAAGLLRGRRLQATWMGVAQGQVTRGGASAW